MMREYQVRICEGLGVKVPGPTRHERSWRLPWQSVRYDPDFGRSPCIGRTARKCLASRASPVHTAARNCTRDEGGPFGFGDQVTDPKPPRAATVKSRGGERRGNAETMIPAGTVERGERKRTAAEVSKLA